MKIGIASDHAGYDYKNKIKLYLSSKNYIITDFGCNSIDSVDYPDFSHKLSKSIENKENTNDPKTPDKVFLGLILVNFFHLKIFPKAQPPTSEHITRITIHNNKINEDVWSAR